MSQVNIEDKVVFIFIIFTLTAKIVWKKVIKIKNIKDNTLSLQN